MAETAPAGLVARLGVAKAAVLALLVALGLIGWNAVPHVGESRRVGDFGSFYTVGEHAAAGRYDAIYDREKSTFRLTMREPAIRVAWTYPPPALFLVRPLAWFEVPTARWLWTVALALAAAAAAAIAARDARAALLALPFPGLQLALWQGQFSPLLALALAPAVGFADRRPFLAGLALGGLVFKPHLLVGPGLVMLGAARWRVAAGAATSGILLGLAALAVHGWSPWPAFMLELARRAGEVSLAGAQAERMITPFGLAATLLGPGRLALALHAACALATLAIAIRLWRRPADPAARALALVVAALIVPMLGFEYDLALLLLPVAAWVGELARGGRVPSWTGIALAALALAAGPIAFAAWYLAALQPASLALLAALALAWRRAERRPT